MVEENTSETNAKNSDQSRKSTATVPVPDAPSGKPGTTDSAAKQDDDLSEFERRMYRLTWLGIAVAAITASVIYMQVRGLIDQNQILSAQAISSTAGSIIGELNTRKQLALAQQQAQAATDAVNQSVADSTENSKRVERQLKILYDQADAAKKQATTAERAVDASVRQFQAAERPWVPFDNITLTRPLQFSEGSASMGFSYTLRNTGRSPALAVGVKSQLLPLHLTAYTGAGIAELLKRYCEPTPQIQESGAGIAYPGDERFPIFPGDKISGTITPGLSQKEIQDGLRNKAPWQPAEEIAVALIVCVDYQLSFALGHHQTRYAWQIATSPYISPEGAASLFYMTFKPKGAYPAARLVSMGQTAD